MKNHKLSKKTLFVLTFLTLIFLGGYYYIFMDIKTRSENISTLSQELSMQSNKQGYLVSTQKMINSISSDIDRINNSIVPKDGDVAFIENLETLAKDNGLTIDIDSLVFEDDSKLEAIDVTAFKIKAKISGGWIGTYTFLSQIESMPLKVKINRFASSANSQATTSVWQSSFDITVLKYK